MAIFNGYTSRAQCIRDLRKAGFTFTSALGGVATNPKVVKGQKLNVLTAPHNLAPSKESGWNVCPSASAGCIAACLHTAGNPIYLNAKIKARGERTRAFFTMRKTYIALLAFEIEALERKANKLGMVPAWRPNTTSDYPFHTVALTVNGKGVKSLIHHFDKVQAYDYTKIPKKAFQWANNQLPSNYHITFSKSEVNDSDVAKVLNAGGNVAIVFGGKTLPSQYKGFPVINGDESDVRFYDETGVVIGLKAKGEARGDVSGFVVRELVQ